MRARTAIRAMGTFRDPVDLQRSGKSNTKISPQETWVEMADEDAMKSPTPETGKSRVTGDPESTKM